MKFTKEIFEAGRSDAGGHNLAQLKALGLEMPAMGWPKAGWPERLIGSDVTEEQYAEFMRLRKGGPRPVQQLSLVERMNDCALHYSPAIDQNVESVRRKLIDRSRVGIKKYGTTTNRAGLSRKQWLIHAQEEALDLAVYLEELIREEEEKDSPEAAANELFKKTGRNLA